MAVRQDPAAWVCRELLRGRCQRAVGGRIARSGRSPDHRDARCEHAL